MTGAKFRNWLMFWLFHKAQSFNFKEKTLSLENVSWHGMKPSLNYAKKYGYSTYYCRKSQKAYAIYYAKQSIFSRSMGGFKIPNFVKLGSKRKSQTGTFSVYKRLKKVNNDDKPSFSSDKNVDVNNGEASEFESYLNSLAGTTKQSPDTPLKILYEAGLAKIEKLGRHKI